MSDSNHHDPERRVVSLDSIVGNGPHALILGSMPGAQSLAAGRYYIHPQNGFWKIMRALGLCGDDDYDTRVEALKSRGIALWDSLHSCERRGRDGGESSMDGDIDVATEAPNDFSSFFTTYPTIRAVFFNGAKAEQAFKRHVMLSLDETLIQKLQFSRLPSTSPAHAVPLEKKIEAWRVVLDAL